MRWNASSSRAVAWRALAAVGLVTGSLGSMSGTPARAATVINVPADQPTIQAGIDAAADGETVLVAPGTYHERLLLSQKSVEVRSSAGPETTIIDGDYAGPVVVFQDGGGVLQGFTITHGKLGGPVQPPVISGAGVAVVGGGATILDYVITDNDAAGSSGGGIGAWTTSFADIERNRIVGNHTSAVGAGGGIAANRAWIQDNVIENNSAGGGGGMLLSGSIRAYRNVIVGNHAGAFGGGGVDIVGADPGDGPFIADSLVAGNSADSQGGGIFWQDTGTANHVYVLGSTVADNQAPVGSALVGASGEMHVVNNVVEGSSASSLVSCTGTAVEKVSFSHNDFYNATASPFAGCADPTGTNDNVTGDPRFVAPTASPPDYHLQAGSPAIDTADPYAGYSNTDLAGAPRPVDGNGDGLNGLDMGPYEAPAVPVVGDRFHPLDPARILDTRIGQGAPTGVIGPGGTLTLQVTGQGGIPATNVSAVVLNVTVTQSTAPSYLTAFPTGQPLPLAANLTFVAGQTVSNLVTVKVGDGGKVDLYNAAGSTHVVADVAGWYGGDTSYSGARYNTVVPSRILDTRYGVGAPAAAVGAGETLNLQVTGHGGIPATGVSAVVLNVTVTQPTAPSYMTAFPTGLPLPLAANLTFPAGQTVPNLVLAKVGDGGMISLYNAAGSTHVVADVAGWFGDDAGPGGLGYVSVVPTRVLDTRSGVGAPASTVGPGGTLDLQVTGEHGIPATGVAAVVLNVTVTQPTAPSYLTAFPTGVPLPLAANLTFVAGQTVPNLVVVKVGDGGKIRIYNAAGSTHIVADLAGWYAA